MESPLRVISGWDEVAGEVVGHVEGLPEIEIHGGTVEAFEENLRSMLLQLDLKRSNAVVVYPDRTVTLDLVA